MYHLSMGITLNCIGSFDNPWKDVTQEGKDIDDWHWSPGIDTFQAVFGRSATTVPSFSKFLGTIQQQAPHSIIRINLISHGNAGLIAFKGDIHKIPNSKPRVMLDRTTAITTKVLMDTEPTMQGNTAVDSLGGMAIKLRNRFAKGAVIYLYLCDSGADLEVMQTLANSLQVTVKGFSSEIWYRPNVKREHNRVTIDRGLTSRSDNIAGTQGFSHLNPDVTRTPRPDPPPR